MRRLAPAAILLALLAPAAAFAHGSIAPTAARPDASQRFVLTVFNTLQGGPEIIGVRVTVPAGASLESAESSPPRWGATVTGATITWQGGPMEGLSEEFAFRARMPSAEGTVTFQSQEIYRTGAGPLFALPVTVSGLAAPAAGGGSTGGGDDDLAWIAIALAATALLVALGAAIAAASFRRRLRRLEADPGGGS